MQLQSEHRSLQAAHDKLTLSGTSKDRECVRLKEEKVSCCYLYVIVLIYVWLMILLVFYRLCLKKSTV